MNKKSIERVAVIVLNYKAPSDTLICIQSLLSQSYTAFDIIVIENGSHDNSSKQLGKLEKQHPSKVTILYNNKNLGFAGGVNVGLNWAMDHGYTYAALFNNDATADVEWLEALVNSIQSNDRAGIATGLLLRMDGKTIDSTGEQYSKWGLAFPRARDKKRELAPKTGLIFGATGGASIYNIAMLQEIGLFDESFFAYYEDTDMSFRAQLAGWKVIYTPNAIAYHKQGATSSKMPGFAVYQTFKNLPLLYAKNVPRELLFTVGIRFWLAYTLMLGHAIKKGAGLPAIKGWLKSIVLFWTTALLARRVIQKRKKVPTSYIKNMLWPDLPPDQTGLRKLRRLFTGK